MPRKTQRHHRRYLLHCVLNSIFGFLRAHNWHSVWHYLFVISSSLATAFLGLLQFMDVKDQQHYKWLPEWVLELASEIWTHRFEVALALVAATFVTGILSAITGFIQELCVKNLVVIKKCLEAAVEEHFEDRQNGHTYRATLFRAFRVPGVGGWLGIVQRSGDVYVTWRTIFCIDPQHKECCTGIIGECWWNAHAQLKSKFYGSLPEIQSRTDVSLDYLDKGFLDEREFKKIAKASLFFHATEIRVNGKVWGVLVLDSTDPNAQATTDPKRKKHDAAIYRAASEITRLLE